MSALRASMASSAVIFLPPMLAQPAATTRAKPPTTTRITRVLMWPPLCGGTLAGFPPSLPVGRGTLAGFPSSLPVGRGTLAGFPSSLPVGALLPDLVSDRGNRFQILRDGQAVGVRQVLASRQRALDDLRHQATGHVAVRLVAAAEGVGDLLHGPAADARLTIRRDVGHGLVLRPFRIAREEPAVVGRHRHGAGRVALPAVADGFHEILAARDAGGRRLRRPRLRP